MPILFYLDDIQAGEFENSIGFGLDRVPFYNPETGEQLGYYSDFATETGGSDECLVQGVFSFDEDMSSDTVSFASTINLSFTCSSESNAVVGGTGSYGCASGYEQFAFEDDSLLGTDLYICGSLCPS